MKKVLVVAKWEYIERLKSKMFIISLIIFPIVIFALAALPAILASRMDDQQKVIGVIDKEGHVLESLIQRFQSQYLLPDGNPAYVVRKINSGENDIEKLRRIANELVFNEEVIGYLYIPSDVYESNLIEYYSTSVGNVRDHGRFTRVVQDILTGVRLQERGIDPSIVDEVIKNVSLRTIRISPRGEERESGFLEIFWSSYIFIIVMMMMIATTGQILIRSVVEEKANRIIEMLASSCSPSDLMAGKILGLSALGLTQIGFYALIGAAVVIQFNIEWFSLGNVWLLLPYFILGYLFYAAIFVAVGSPLSSEQEAQQITGWIIMLLMIPFIFAFIAMENPTAPIVRLLSFIPFLTPSFMALRIPIQMPPTSEILVTLGILLIATYIMMRIAAKIFRVAILAYGKRPTMRELISWLRAG